MKRLFLIMARGGSKRLPGKNIKLLNGKPLIGYAIDCALEISGSENIYVSTDNDDIIKVVEEYGVRVPFKRPAELAEDNSSSESAMMHAVDFYEKSYGELDYIVLLQPTSPFRTASQVKEAIKLFEENPGVDMVVSVKKALYTPYSNMFEENSKGFLKKSKITEGEFPSVYSYNGAIYVISVNSLRKFERHTNFEKIIKYEMDKLHSVDIDEKLDWLLAEQIIKHKLI